MTKEEQYWEDVQKALDRIFDLCEEIDPKSDYKMIKDFQFVRGFVNKHRPKESEANMDYETLRNSMTVQDAARVLKETNCYGTMDIAKNVILKALETQPCNDCISREATLTAFSDYVGGGMSMNDFDAMWDIVVKMPPVEPKPKTSEDCISRKAAIDALHRYFAEGFNEDRWWNSTYVLDAINKVPSVTPQPKEEPQPKTGHWIEHKHGGIEHIECSKCKCWFLRKDLIRNSYCPNCGSRNHWEWELMKMQEVKK